MAMDSSVAVGAPALPVGRTALHAPPAGWDGPMARDKQFWMWALWLSSFLLIAVSFAWFFVGKQQTPALHRAVTPESWQAQVQEWTRQHETAPGSGIVSAPDGGDVYLLSRM